MMVNAGPIIVELIYRLSVDDVDGRRRTKICDFLCRVPCRDWNYLFYAPVLRNTILLAKVIFYDKVDFHFHIRADAIEYYCVKTDLKSKAEN